MPAERKLSALIAAILALGLIAGSSASAQSSTKTDDLAALQRAVRDDPAGAQPRYALGVALLRRGNYFAAEQELALADDRHYPLGKVRPRLAEALFYLGREDELLHNITPCPDDKPCAAEVRALQARAMMHLRIIDEAKRQIDIALADGPGLNGPRLAQAEYLLISNDAVGAERLVDMIIGSATAESGPTLFDALALKGDLRRRFADFQGAEAAYRRLLSLLPSLNAVRNRLAICLIAEGRLEEANAEIQQSLNRPHPSLLSTYLAALLLSGTGKMPQAMETVRALERQIAEIPLGSLLLAIIHAGNGNMEEALTYSGRFHADKPTYLPATLLLARVEFTLSDYDRVIKLLAPELEKLRKQGDGLALLGSAYLAVGRNKQASDLLRQAVALSPDDLSLQARLALALARDPASRKDGIKQLDMLMQHAPSNRDIGLVLISLLLDQDDPDPAITVADHLIAAKADDALPLVLRGAALLAKGDRKQAESDFARALKLDEGNIPVTLYLADLAMKDGRFDMAGSLIERSLRSHPTDSNLLLARATLDKYLGNAPAAAIDLDRAISTKLDDIVARSQLLQALMAQGEVATVAKVANNLAQTLAADPTALDIAARALMTIGHANDALPIYRDIQTLLPQIPETSLQLAGAYLRAGRKTEARAAYDRVLALDAANLPAWRGRIFVEWQTQGADSALAMLRKLPPQISADDAKMLTADLMEQIGRLAEAEAAYQALFDHLPNSVTLRRLTQNLMRQGQTPRALAMLKDWLGHHPTDDDSRRWLAESLLTSGDWSGAADQWSSLLTRQPGNAMAANNLAWLYGKLGDARALPMAERAYHLAPSERQIADTYGVLLDQKGDPRRAMPLLQQALASDPDNPGFTYHLALALADNKQPGQARQLLKGLIDRKTAFDESEAARQLYNRLGGG